MSLREIVVQDRAELARRVAEEIAALSRGGEPPVTIALSGGSTPKVLYETLARPPLFDEVAWPRLELFFSDERAVPPDDPDSNYGLAARTLLAKVPSTVHRMQAERDAADAYERLILERVKKRRGGIPAFDLILLGMGDDGHTASLFPGTRALEENTRLVVMNDVPKQKKTRRMTFTYPLIDAADRVWVLVAGADKREIVARCREARARGEHPFPLLRVAPEGEFVWWLDEAASGRA